MNDQLQDKCIKRLNIKNLKLKWIEKRVFHLHKSKRFNTALSAYFIYKSYFVYKTFLFYKMKKLMFYVLFSVQ